MPYKRLAIFLPAFVLLAGISAIIFLTERPAEVSARDDAAPEHGGVFKGDDKSFTAYGWSTDADTATACRESFSVMTPSVSKNTTLSFVFYTKEHSSEAILSAAREMTDPGTVIVGCTSGYGVVGPDGYHASANGVIGQLSLCIPGMKIGVGGATVEDAANPAEVANLALKRAMKSAGSDGAKPSIIFMFPTFHGYEEAYLDAIQDTLGTDVPIFGGTAASGAGVGSVIANDQIIKSGLSLVAVYSDNPFGHVFRGGFDVTNKSGTVTSSEGRTLLEIDGRPALDVYDEWSGGLFREGMRAGRDMSALTALYPLCRTMIHGEQRHNLFVHAQPPDSRESTHHLITSANVRNGDVVTFSEGSWNILLNRIGLLPGFAREQMKGVKAQAGLLVCCEGVLQNIPEDQRNQIARLLNNSLGETPWIGFFTWGEQGYLSGLGSYHGNVHTSLTLFPEADVAKD